MRSDGLVLTFTCADVLLGVPVARVEEVLRHHGMTTVPLAPPAVAGLMNLRGQIVLAVDLRARMGLPSRDPGTVPMHVVVRGEGALHSLLVDGIGEVVPIHADSERVPDRLASGIRRVATAVHKLPDRLIVALDLDALIDPAHLAR